MQDKHHHSTPTTLYSGKHLALVAEGHWEYAARTVAKAAVGIVAVTPDRNIILVEQYRIPAGRRVIEIPAGLVGDLPEVADEPLLVAAQRELLEETGYESDEWTHLVEMYSSAGLTNESVTLYLAENVRKTGIGGGDESESIVVHEVPLAEADAWIAHRQEQGDGADFKLLAALHLVAKRLS
jgi:ADP-ribose pyrophosphatase